VLFLRIYRDLDSEEYKTSYLLLGIPKRMAAVPNSLCCAFTLVEHTREGAISNID
jgi:hypothetical protein